MTRRRRREVERDGVARELLAQKQQLRDPLRLRRSQWPVEEAALASQAACEALGAWSGFERAGAVAFYAAFEGELDLRSAFLYAVERCKACFFPRCEDSGRVAFVEVREWESLRPGRYGIFEPEGPAAALPTGDTLVLVPGLAFDWKGNRLGMGRGYYDRTFPENEDRGIQLVGAGFHWQIVNRVPRGPNDCVMDFLLTDEGVLPAAGEGRRDD